MAVYDPKAAQARRETAAREAEAKQIAELTPDQIAAFEAYESFIGGEVDQQELTLVMANERRAGRPITRENVIAASLPLAFYRGFLAGRSA